MKKRFLLACGLLLAGMAHSQMPVAKRFDQATLQKDLEAFKNRQPEHPAQVALLKPTGDRQRLVRAFSGGGTPGGASYTNWDMYYQYSGFRGSSTGLHGSETYSEFDSAYSVSVNPAYQTQQFYPDGRLKQLVTFYGHTNGSDLNPAQFKQRDFDAQGRLLMDSLRQTSGQVAFNDHWVAHFHFDAFNREDYRSWIYQHNSVPEEHYRWYIWKKYKDADTLPATDSMLISDFGVLSTTVIRHTYNPSGKLLADSTFVIENGVARLIEVSSSSYPENGVQHIFIQRLKGETWFPYGRETIKTDLRNRQTLWLVERHQNSIWAKYYRMERAYTYDTQADTMPTQQFIYWGSDYNTWYLNSREKRTFDASLKLDTLYTWGSSTGVIGAYHHPNFTVYRYNDFGNLEEEYHHNFMEDNFIEINGYYTRYYYELYDDLLSAANLSKAPMGLSFYPNPATNTLKLHMTGEKYNKLSISICNINGKTVLQGTLNASNSIDISALVPGTYIIKATDPQTGNSSQSKVCKQ